MRLTLSSSFKAVRTVSWYSRLDIRNIEKSCYLLLHIITFQEWSNNASLVNLWSPWMPIDYPKLSTVTTPSGQFNFEILMKIYDKRGGGKMPENWWRHYMWTTPYTCLFAASTKKLVLKNVSKFYQLISYYFNMWLSRIMSIIWLNDDKNANLIQSLSVWLVWMNNKWVSAIQLLTQ